MPNLPIFEYLPKDLKIEDLYMFLTVVIAVVVVYMLFNNVMAAKKVADRVKALQNRRAQLKGQIMAPRKRSKKTASSTTSMDMIRVIVDRMNLIQKSQVGKINRTLINAGYRSKDA